MIAVDWCAARTAWSPLGSNIGSIALAAARAALYAASHAAMVGVSLDAVLRCSSAIAKIASGAAFLAYRTTPHVGLARSSATHAWVTVRATSAVPTVCQPSS